MTWNIRKHRRGNECTEYLYPRLVSWESSHRRQWDTICSPHPCGTVQYVLFQIQGRWIIFLFFLLQKSFPRDSILSDLPPLEHQWGISGHLKKAHWEREISSMCCSWSTGADPWTDFLSWFPRHNRCLFTCDQAFRQSTAGGREDQLNEQWNNFMWPWTALTAWCVVQYLKKTQLYWWILIFTERAAACQQYSLLVCTWGYP